MNVTIYARVSDPKQQDTPDKVSIDQQLADQRALVARNGWQTVGEFVDRKYYKATQAPKKGKQVNPSGERADRPQFLAMLEVVKAGDADIVLCWRDDRLVRHPRVAVALEDALDIGDTQRNGKPKIEVRDATGAMIDRFTLSIKATIWREENKRRAERTKMGKLATLQLGRWPGPYWRYGYETHKGETRGCIIQKVESEAQVVQKIHEMFASGASVQDIRQYLRANAIEQKGIQKRRHEWEPTLIYQILHSIDYTGIATWKFNDGTAISIDIPIIVPLDLWKRNQERFERNKQLSSRKAKGVYLLQGLLFCGDCGRAMNTNQTHWYYKNGQRVPYKTPQHKYYCAWPRRYRDATHPRPYTRNGTTLDWQVWRQIVDNGIKRPDMITAYVLGRQAELQAQGESVDGDISHVQRRLAEVGDERAFYQRQAARGKMTEQEFDTRIDETDETLQYWQVEIARLQELRDNQAKIQMGLDYVTTLLTKIQSVLVETDLPPKEMKALPEDRQREILVARRDIIQALCNRVQVYASGRVVVEGLLDGSEAAQFDLAIRPNDLPKLAYTLLFALECQKSEKAANSIADNQGDHKDDSHLTAGVFPLLHSDPNFTGNVIGTQVR